MKKQLGSALLCALLVLALCACAPSKGENVSKFDAVTYVDGLIKENYLGQFDPEYLELVGISEEEAQSTYHNGIHMDVDYFTYMYGIEYPTDDFEEEVEDLFKEIYSHTKYQVVSAAKQDDGSYSVKVDVEPIDIIQLCESEWDKTVKDFYEKYTTERLNTMTDREYEKVDKEWAQLILDLYKSKMEEIGNQDAQSISIQLELDKDGYYTINSDDFARLDKLILDWSGAGSKV